MRRYRARLAILAGTAAGVAGLLVSPLTTPAWAAGPDSHARHTAADTPWGTALQQAVTGHRHVPVDALTTPNYKVTANPDGSFTATQNVLPVRTRQNGAWVDLNADLAVNRATGAVTPTATSEGIALSPGGSGPLVTMHDNSGHSLSLSLPFKLPAPALDGATALYADVLPGVDLSVTVSDQGGFSDVLIVHNASAARNPALRHLEFATAGHGLAVSATSHGGITARTPEGRVVFAGPAAAMWDSTRQSDRTSARAQGGDQRSGASTTVSSSVAGPGTGARVARLAVRQSGTSLSLVPDAGVLGGPSTHYPVYIDPSLAPMTTTDVSNPASSPTNAMFEAQQGCDYYGSDEHSVATSGEGVGYQSDSSGCVGAEESFFQLNISNLTTSMVISSAKLYLTKTYSSNEDCKSSQSLSVYQTGTINSTMYWGNRPSQIAKLWSGNLGDAYNGAYANTTACGDKYLNFDIASHISPLAGKASTFTFGLYGDESASVYNLTRFDGNPYLQTTFDLYPTLDSMQLSPAPALLACGSSATHGWIGATTLNSAGDSNITLGAHISTYITGEQANVQFSVYDWSTQNGTFVGPLTTPTSPTVDASSTSTAVPPTNIGLAVKDGHSYEWDAQAVTTSSQALNSALGQCYFSVDSTSPRTPTLTAADPSFPQGGTTAASPVKYVGDTINIGVSATDPAPAATCTVNTGSACQASGIDHFVWQFDTQPAANTSSASTCYSQGLCGLVTPSSTTTDAAGDSTGSATVPAKVPSWGSHTLYVIGVDKAGNPSQTPLSYGFAVPWNPNTKIAPGDFTGDGVPDLLTSASDNHLYIVPGDNTGANETATALNTNFTSTGSATPSPGGDSWSNYLVAHRGNLSNGGVDDVFAYDKATGVMWVLVNDASSGGNGTPGFTMGRTVAWAPKGAAKPACQTADTTRCSAAGYDSADWSAVTHLAMTQNIYGGTSTYPDLITTENNGSLWIYQTNSGGLSNPVLLGDGDWSNYDLITPGSVSGTPVLWVRDRANGNVYSYDIATSGTNNLPPLLHAPGSTTLISGVSTSGNQLCLADPAASRTDGTALILWGCDNGPEQHFTLGTDGTIRVLGKCLATLNNSTGSGAWVDITTCNGDSHQQWTTGINGQLVNTASGLCLADPAATTTTGTKQIIYACLAGHAEQNWNGGSSAALSTTPTGPFLINLPVSSNAFVVSPGDINSPTSGPDGYPDLYTMDASGKLTEHFGAAPSGGIPSFAGTYSLGTPFPSGLTITNLA
ncbi:hypothetical protein ABH931_002337 [Streptacidiphilus sp. MAP12-33]|uniref:ricin-type beta-trefoil lectin domain protein n=1 Tax=Streptacidiphilus sp. MAP12-33 TaxID=3156266 RepID=UPI0035159DAC